MAVLSISDIRASMAEVGEKHPELYGSVLFGSFARGEQDDDSDVDLVVAFDRKIGYLELESLRADLAESFGRDVDLITTFGNLPRHMLEEIRRDGVAVYGR